MTFTTPITWTVGQLVTASQMNVNVRDNTNWLNSAHGCRVWKSATQSVPSGNTDVVSFDSEDFDTDAIHSTVSNNSRLIIPSGMDGKWFFLAFADIDADGADHRAYGISIQKNAAGVAGGGTVLDSKNYAGHQLAQSGSAEWGGTLAAGDYVEMFFKSLSEPRVLQATTSGTNMFAMYLGA